MTKINIKAHEFLADMRSGMDDESLMAKHKLSPKLLDTLCERLIATGYLTSLQLSEFKLLWAQKKGRAWRCPACHMPQSHPFDECPQCGIIVSKFEQKISREKGTSKPEEFVEVPPVESDVPEPDAKSELEKSPLLRQCAACGMQLPSDAKFCTSCGSRVLG